MVFKPSKGTYVSKPVTPKKPYRSPYASTASKERAISGMAMDTTAMALSVKATSASSVYNDIVLSTTTSGRSQVLSAFHTVGTVSLLNGLELSAGGANGTHTADVVRLTSFSIDARILPPYTTTGPFQMRMAIVFDRKPRGSLPSLIDIYAYNENNGSNALSTYAGQNGDNASRFLLIKEWRYSVNGWLNDSTAVTQPPSDKYATPVFGKKKLRLLTEYQGNGGNSGAGIAGISSGALYLVCYGDASNTSGTHPLLTGLVRITYEDVPKFH